MTSALMEVTLQNSRRTPRRSTPNLAWAVAVLVFASSIVLMACVEQSVGTMTQAVTDPKDAELAIEQACSGVDIGPRTEEAPPNSSMSNPSAKPPVYVSGDVWVFDNVVDKQACDLRRRRFESEVNFGILCYRLYAFCCETIYPYPRSPPVAYCDERKLECYAAVF